MQVVCGCTVVVTLLPFYYQPTLTFTVSQVDLAIRQSWCEHTRETRETLASAALGPMRAANGRRRSSGARPSSSAVDDVAGGAASAERVVLVAPPEAVICSRSSGSISARC